MESLLDLPEGASYHRKTGRVSLKASRRGNKLLIESEADSLGRTVTTLRRHTENVRQQADSSKQASRCEASQGKKITHREPPWLVCIIAGMALCAALPVLIYKYKTMIFKR